jgi:hypothetical protein
VASYVALREYRQWYNRCALLWRAEAIHLFPWLQDSNAGAPCAASTAFPHFVEALEHAVALTYILSGMLKAISKINVIRTRSLLC